MKRKRKSSTADREPRVRDRDDSGSLLERSLDLRRAVLIISLLSCLAYANSLSGDFVFDDVDVVVKNPDVRSWGNLGRAFTSDVWAFRERTELIRGAPPLPYYRPLFTSLITVEYQLFGTGRTQGWHLVSLLIHSLCSVSVFYVLLALSGRRTIALMAAAVFAVFPAHAESVTWISGITDPLYAVFMMTAFYLYLKHRAAEDVWGLSNRNGLLVACLLFALSLLAKETGAALLLLVFGHAIICSSGNWLNRVRLAMIATLPFIAVFILYLIPRYIALGENTWRNPQAPPRPLSYTVLTLPSVLWGYLSHLAWPVGLSVTYQTSFVTSPGSQRFLIPGALLVVAAAILVIARNRITSQIWLALLLLLVPLVPVLNIGQISRPEYLISDRYLYLSAAGWAYLLALLAVAVGGLIERRFAFLPPGRTAPIISATLAVLMVLGCIRENRNWADAYSLWSHATRVSPGYWATHYNLGLALLDLKKFDQARDAFLSARSLAPDSGPVLNGLGRAYDGLGETNNAVDALKQSIEIDPSMFESLNDLGAVYFRLGDYKRAEELIVRALQFRPGATAARFNLALCYDREGRYSDAIKEFEQVVAVSPDDGEAYYELSRSYEHAGRMDDALRVLRRALETRRTDALAQKISDSIERITKRRNGHGGSPE
ncbi:MAG TPA: tetratricopeptide repeat protein [Blastocatellia bacterium]|nr:tetratricopeptide repeat protein [Blastocatellia bacterium]